MLGVVELSTSPTDHLVLIVFVRSELWDPFIASMSRASVETHTVRMCVHPLMRSDKTAKGMSGTMYTFSLRDAGGAGIFRAAPLN